MDTKLLDRNSHWFTEITLIRDWLYIVELSGIDYGVWHVAFYCNLASVSVEPIEQAALRDNYLAQGGVM